MSAEPRQRAYYGYFYGLAFGGLLTGTMLANAESTFWDILATCVISVFVIAPTLSAVAFVIGLVADRIDAVLRERLCSHRRIREEAVRRIIDQPMSYGKETRADLLLGEPRQLKKTSHVVRRAAEEKHGYKALGLRD
jgi:hypothetical protein